jgi:5,10-methylenetetrahydromethanopterin reductase
MEARVNEPGLLLWNDISTNEFLELVDLAEQTGYSELWYTDARFQRDVYVGLALAAQRTKRMLLGPGVNDPYSRHPAMIAMAVATLDEVSGGRACLGLGSGGSGIKEMGIAQDRPVRALREAIELIRLMLGGEVVHYDGQMYRLNGTGLGFTPRRPAIPIFIATHSPQILALSGRLADGILLANIGRRRALEHAIAQVRTAESEVGREPGAVAIHLRLETCISDDEEGALRVLRQRLATRIVRTFPRWSYLEELEIVPTDAMRQVAEARDIGAMSNLLTAADVRSTTLAGTVDSVVQQLDELLIPEVKKITIRPMAFEGQRLSETVTRFISEVWPRLQRARV